MKARNNKTGEIVTNFGISKEFGTISYIDNTNTFRFSTACDAEWTIIEEETSFDWQSFRAEAAKDILCAIISQPNLGYYGDEVENAVIFADKLIAKLKEKEEK